MFCATLRDKHFLDVMENVKRWMRYPILSIGDSFIALDQMDDEGLVVLNIRVHCDELTREGEGDVTFVWPYIPPLSSPISPPTPPLPIYNYEGKSLIKVKSRGYSSIFQDVQTSRYHCFHDLPYPRFKKHYATLENFPVGEATLNKISFKHPHNLCLTVQSESGPSQLELPIPKMLGGEYEPITVTDDIKKIHLTGIVSKTLRYVLSLHEEVDVVRISFGKNSGYEKPHIPFAPSPSHILLLELTLKDSPLTNKAVSFTFGFQQGDDDFSFEAMSSYRRLIDPLLCTELLFGPISFSRRYLYQALSLSSSIPTLSLTLCPKEDTKSALLLLSYFWNDGKSFVRYAFHELDLLP